MMVQKIFENLKTIFPAQWKKYQFLRDNLWRSKEINTWPIIIFYLCK